jgi:hypothetical protein
MFRGYVGLIFAKRRRRGAMKKFVLLALACFATAGCKKAFDDLEKQSYESGHQKDKSKPEIGDLSGGAAGGGGGGAVMAVHGAVKREDLEAALQQIRLFIDNASIDGTMPPVQTTYAALQREAPKFAKFIDDKHITLHPAMSREDVWAWAKLPQGNYAVASASGIERMTLQQLNQRLGY